MGMAKNIVAVQPTVFSVSKQQSLLSSSLHHHLRSTVLSQNLIPWKLILRAFTDFPWKLASLTNYPPYGILLFFDCRVYDITGLECNDPEMSMKLVFHAIIPLQFWDWDEKSSIFMRFGHPKLGDWVADCGQFEVGRYGYHNIVLHSYYQYDRAHRYYQGFIPYFPAIKHMILYLHRKKTCTQ